MQRARNGLMRKLGLMLQKRKNFLLFMCFYAR